MFVSEGFSPTSILWSPKKSSVTTKPAASSKIAGSNKKSTARYLIIRNFLFDRALVPRDSVTWGIYFEHCGNRYRQCPVPASQKNDRTGYRVFKSSSMNLTMASAGISREKVYLSTKFEAEKG
jgi:hypothetical protein